MGEVAKEDHFQDLITELSLHSGEKDSHWHSDYDEETEEMSRVLRTDETLYRILKNELNHLLESTSQNPAFFSEVGRTFVEHMLRITATVFKDMPVREIVNVQPLQGPVGIIYRLTYKKGDYNKFTLEVQPNPAESGYRHLGVGLSMEAMQDLNTMHGPKAVDEYLHAIAMEIRDELTAELITDLGHLATQFDDELPKCGPASSTDPLHNVLSLMEDKSIRKSPTTQRVTNNAVAVHEAANDIARATWRGAGNFAIVGLKVFNDLYKIGSGTKTVLALNDFESAEFKVLSENGAVLKSFGRLNGIINLYVSNVIDEDQVIVGYKGRNSEVDSGLTWAPYIPVVFNGIAVNPVTFQPMCSFGTRYGKHFEVDGLSASAGYYRSLTWS